MPPTTTMIVRTFCHKTEHKFLSERKNLINIVRTSQLQIWFNKTHFCSSSMSILTKWPSSSSLFSTVPFYGAPLPPSSRYLSPQESRQQQFYLPSLSPLQRLATLIHSSITAMNDPKRADAVAAVGEITGSFALSRMMQRMNQDIVGRRILRERPVVNERVADRALLLLQDYQQRDFKSGETDDDIPCHLQSITFGAAYANFLQRHGYHPNERSTVRFISDPDLSYVMTRYRQCHDFWHVLTNLPPTVLGELALKWIELIQTGLPLAALSVMGGTLGVSGLSEAESKILWNVYFPWAIRVGRNMKEHSLMCVYYEEEFETDLSLLRKKMGIEPAPIVEGLS